MSADTPETMTPAMMEAFLYPGVSCAASVPVAPRFQVGDCVIVRVAHPETYTRSPRYVRGKKGVVSRDYGAFAFPDTMGQRLGEHPQHCYAVRFTARELWGPDAPARDVIHVDLYDDHLEPA
jgi:nitrile hydratase